MNDNMNTKISDYVPEGLLPTKSVPHTRDIIRDLIMEGGHTCTEMEGDTGLSRRRVVRHIAALRDDGLPVIVVRTSEGRHEYKVAEVADEGNGYTVQRVHGIRTQSTRLLKVINALPGDDRSSRVLRRHVRNICEELDEMEGVANEL